MSDKIEKGTILLCPKCYSTEGNKVYHSSWSAITCNNCKELVNKEDWINVAKEFEALWHWDANGSPL